MSELLKKLQKTAKAYRDRRWPLSAQEVADITGFGYFDTCDYSHRLLSLGIINVAEMSGGLIQAAVFAPELTGENLDEVVKDFHEDALETVAMRKRIKELESVLLGFKAKIDSSFKKEER